MTQKDAIKTLYPVYSKNTAKPVTEEEFRNRLADPQKRKVLYNGFSNLGYADRLGTYEQFEKWLDESQQNPANVPIQEPQRPGIVDAQPISTDAQAQPQNNAHAQSYAQQTPPTATGENAQDILRTGIAQGLKEHDKKQDAILKTKEEGVQLQQMYDLFEKENEDAIFLAKTKRATAGVPGMVMPGSAYTEQEADVIKQRNTLRSALELNKKTQEILAAPSRFDDSNAFANFGKGVGSKATDIDFWTFGITNIAKNLNTRDVAMKLQKAQDEYGEDVDIDTILTEPEKALLGAFFNNLHASALRADDLSLGYQAGQQAMESAKYMAEFILTGGITKAATKGATKALETWIIKNVASKAGRTLAKGGLAVTKGLVATAARTPVMLSTLSNITDKAVEYDENGRLINGYKAIVLGFADSFIGNLAETMGEHIIATIKLPFTSLISQIPEMGFTKFFQNLSKTGAYKLMKQGGWNGFAAEYFEEWYDNSTRALIGDKEALRDFATIEQQLITLASFAPITILGGAVSTAQYASAQKNFQNATLALKDILKDNGYKTSQAEYIMDLIMDTTPSQMAKKVAPIINQMALETEGDAGNLLTGISEFIRTKSIIQGYDGIYEAEHQEKRNELDQDMQNEIGEYTNKKGEVEMAVDKDGNANYVLSDVADELEPLIVIKGLDGQTKMVSKSEYQANYTPSVLTSKDEYLSEMIMTKQTQELAEETKIEEDANFLNSIELGVPQYFNINGVMTEGTPQAITPDGSITVHFGNHVEMLTADQYKALNQPTAVTAAQTEELAQAEQEQAEQEQAAQEQAEQEQEELAKEQAQPAQEEAAQEQTEPQAPAKELPKTKDGETDFDALLDVDPETYAQELAKAIGDERAANTMSALAKQTDAQIEKLQKRLEKETSTNKIVSINKEIDQLQQRRDALTGLIAKGSKPQTPQTPEVTGAQTTKTAQPVQAGQVGQNVTDKWNNTPKQQGIEETFTLPNGKQIKGRWVLTEAGAATPSHDPHTLQPSEGFPVTKDGKNVNDNDYTKKAAEVETMAQSYDSRAIDHPIFVKNGIVVSGNNRTMSGILAAERGTDTKYREALAEKAKKMGFSPEQIAQFKNPRLYVEISEDLPLNTETFALFNQRETKSKTPTERAIVVSKRDNTQVIGLVSRELDGYERLSDLYQNEGASTAIAKYLIEGGLINQNELPELFENGSFTPAGKDFLESVLVGSVMKEDQVKILSTEGMKSTRQRVVKAIVPLIENSKLREEGRIIDDINTGIKYLYGAKKAGMTLREYFLQSNMFEAATYDLNGVWNALMLQGTEKDFRDYVQLTNKRLKDPIANMFTGEMETKDDVYQELENQYNDEQRRTIEAARAANAQSGAANDQGAVLPGGPKDNEPGGPGISADAGEQTEASPATNEGPGSEVDTQPTYSEQKEDPGQEQSDQGLVSVIDAAEQARSTREDITSKPEVGIPTSEESNAQDEKKEEPGIVSVFKAAQEHKEKNEAQNRQDGKGIIPQKISKPKMPKTKEEYCSTLANIVSNSPTKPIVSGVLFDADNKMIVATDAFKLVAIPSNLPKTTEIIGASKRKSSGVEFGQLLKGQYPNYKAVIPLSPSERFEGRFNIELLLGQALTILKEANERIKQLDKPTDQEKAHERILKFGIHNVNAKQLSDVLRALYDTGTKHVIVEYTRRDRPLVFRDERDMNKVGLLMPVYIPEEGEDGFEERFRNIPVLVNRNTIAINKEPGSKKEKNESEKEDSAMKPDNSPVAEEEEKADKQAQTEKIDNIFASFSDLAPHNEQLWANTSISRWQANKFLKDIRDFQDAAITNGNVDYQEYLDNHNYEMIEGKEVKINIYKLNGYTIELGYDGSLSTHGASGIYTQVENPQGEVLKIYVPKYRTEKTIDISYRHPRFIEKLAKDVTESTKQSPKRFEQGSKLNEKEKSDVLKTMKDSYKEMNRERSLEAGLDGNERFVWKGNAEDYMAVSDITGRKVRWYVTMPDGKIAHPTELYPNMTNEDIKSAENSDNYHLQQSEVNYRNGAKKLAESKKSVIDQLQKALDAGLEFVKTYDSSDVRERNPVTMIRTNVRTKENPNGMIIPLQEYMANNNIDIPDLKNFDWERYYNDNTRQGEQNSHEAIEGADVIDPSIKPKKGDKIAFEIGGREVKFEYDSFISDKNGTLTYDYFGMKTLKPGEYRIERDGNVINVKQGNGSNTKPESTEEREGSEKIEDFGEKIEGAKKDIWQKNEATSEDIKSLPLSKIFPRPDFPQLVKDGKLPVESALLLRYLYDTIPPRPRKEYKLRTWVSGVKGVIDAMNTLIDNPSHHEQIMSKMGLLLPSYHNSITTYIALHKELGFPETDLNTGKYEVKRFDGRGYSILHGPYIISDHETLAEAAAALKRRIEQTRKKLSNGDVKLSIYQDTRTKKYFIGRKGATGIVRLVDNIEKLADAKTMFRDQQVQLQEMWRQLKVKPEERRSSNRERIGVDYRKGKNITPETFSETFGFRGVQFGNWVNNDERQGSLNEAFDALMDLSTTLGISGRALSLNGELGIAFGARGSGKYNAHYEPGQVVINLTKTKGAGSLAHEWWHALDNYFSRMKGEGSKYFTESPRQKILNTGEKDQSVRKEMADSFKALVSAINKSGLPERSKNLDKARSVPYWSTIIEMSARSFENYIIEKLAANEGSNDYLANFKEIGEWAERGLSENNYPYPTKDETEVINPAFQDLFDTIQEKVDQETGNVMLFRTAEEQSFSIYAELDQIKQKAIADGSFMKAPNGKQTNLNERQWLQVRTKAFKEWFGDWENDPKNASKVVDENGEPLVVYHGTNAEFNEFRGNHGQIMFSPSRKYAQIMAGDGKVMEAYLKIESPFEEMDLDFFEWAEDYEEYVEELKTRGYDGAISADDGEQISVFNPSQIKSATDNVGTFDAGNEDIRFRMAQEAEAATDSLEEESLYKDRNSTTFTDNNGNNKGRNTILQEGAVQMQLSWDDQVGDVPAQRAAAIAADPDIAKIQQSAGYNPVIDHGFTAVERVLSNNGTVTFMGNPLTGPAKINGPGDVAFLFKNLESASSENAFIVLVDKKNNYRVLYLSTGNEYSSIIDLKSIPAAIKEFDAAKICMVHNHPSGSLTPSGNDVNCQTRIGQIAREMGIEAMPGVIINLDTGKYAEFTQHFTNNPDRPRKEDMGDVSPVDIYAFDRQILYMPSSQRIQLNEPSKVAQFISQQKRGINGKVHVIILDRALMVSRYFLMDGNLSTSEMLNTIWPAVGKHGIYVMLASNDQFNNVQLSELKNGLKLIDSQLLDVLTIKQDKGIITNYESLSNQGLLDEQVRYEKQGGGKTLLVNGKKRPITNSYGEKIAETEEKVREFWEWFGDSKMVDPQGRPMPVYHGTDKTFDAFRDEVTYFTDAKEDARGYAENRSAQGEPRTIQAYIKIDNPATEKDVLRVAKKLGVSQESNSPAALAANNKVRQELIKEGFDGIANVADFGFLSDFDEINAHAVFTSAQIRSVNESDGIRYRMAQETEAVASFLAEENANTYTELTKDEIPEKTQVAYKLMRYFKNKPGILYPLYARDDDAGKKGFKKGVWYKAERQSVKIGGKNLADRPGIHAVDVPLFLQGKVRKNGETRVWAKVLMPAMSEKTQAENDNTPLLPNGQRAGIRERVIGTKEAYNFKTNPTATGAGAWPIAGSAMVERVITDAEVAKILIENGREDYVDAAMTGDPGIRFRTAWHGSPHSFDKFSTSKIGNGEGALAYGWGLYFTDLEDIARTYADKLSKGKTTKALVDKEELPDEVWEEVGVIMARHGIPGDIAPNQTDAGFIREILDDNRAKLSEDEIQVLLKYAGDLSRNLYKVKIHGDKTLDEMNFMRWDKSIAKKQKAAILSQLKAEGYESDRVYKVIANSTEDSYDSSGDMVYFALFAHFKTLQGASEFLLRAGIDGVQYPVGWYGGEKIEGSYNYVVYDDSAIEVEEHIRFRQLSQAGFYSTVEDALEKIKQEKGTPEQFKAMLLKNGAKQAELDWMDYDGAFTGKSVTKTEIQDWIDQNKIEVEEKINREERGTPIIKKLNDRGIGVAEAPGKDIFYWISNGFPLSAEEKFKNNDLISELASIRMPAPKYSQYTVPGGKNYQELLLTMPVKKVPPKDNSIDIDNPTIKIEAALDILGSEGNEYIELSVDGLDYGGEWIYTKGKTDYQIKKARVIKENHKIHQKALEKGIEEQRKINFQSSHFDEPNILAHVRFNERTVNGERVLFLEEIQSDWAQKGKKEGFKSDNRKAITESLRKEKDNFYTKLNESEDKQVEYGLSQFESGKINREQLDKILLANGYSEYDLKSAVEKSVPDMPFKKTDQWVNLALRRMMRYAAENGFDRIAWTNGEQQAERYDLSKQVYKVKATNEKGSKKSYGWDLWVTDYNKNVHHFTPVDDADLVSLVGKELAEKIINDNPNRWDEKEYSGLDLKVGGEGMKAFYDNIVPKAANKLGKPFGARIEEVQLPLVAKEAYNEQTEELELSTQAEEIQDRFMESQAEEGDYALEDYVKDMKDAGYEVLFENGEPVNLKKITTGQTFTVQSLPVTYAMKESVSGGVPLFRPFMKPRSLNQAGFYSTVEDALERLPQEKGTPDQMKAMLLKNGAKEAEMDWMGWGDHFKGKSITKAEIQDWIDQNRVEVEDVEKGRTEWEQVKQGRWERAIDRETPTGRKARTGRVVIQEIEGKFHGTPSTTKFTHVFKTLEEAKAYYDRVDGFSGNTKFSQYTVPGGSNYRELLLMMPGSGTMSFEEFAEDHWGDISDLTDRQKELAREQYDRYWKNTNRAKIGFKSGHFDEPNILAHVRFNERTVNGERVLFLEEIQSDWAQKGKKEGFKGDYKNKSLVEPRFDGKYWYLHEKGSGEMTSSQSFRTEAEAWKQIEGTMRLMDNGVPNMPFKKTDQWVNLALRRMMRYAAENGFDRIAWTNGEQQAARYDLSKQVDRINWTKRDDKFDISPTKNGKHIGFPVGTKTTNLTKTEVANLVGKEIADKIEAETGKNYETGQLKQGVLSGLDLKVGGEGMIAFYDQIVPKAANKLGKPFGAKIEEVQLPLVAKDANDGQTFTVQSLPVTYAMKESVSGGVPLFRPFMKSPMRERIIARDRLESVADKLNIKVNIVNQADLKNEKQKRAKGFFEPRTGNITIVLDNHKTADDAIATLLHEAVAHKGLRNLFGADFDRFLDNVYQSAGKEVRAEINMLIAKNGWDTRLATEEYLATLAESTDYDQNESLWRKIKNYFMDMLRRAGIKMDGVLTDADLRYILQRSYDRLTDPSGPGGVFDAARDAQIRRRVGLNSDNDTRNRSNKNAAQDKVEQFANNAYDARLNETINKVREAHQDSMLSLKILQEEVAKASDKEIQTFEDAYLAENHISSKNLYEKEHFMANYYEPMSKAIRSLADKLDGEYQSVVTYAMAKHGLERNIKLAERDAEKMHAKWKAELDKKLAQELIDQAKYDKEIKRLEAKYDETVEYYRGRDYSGLTSLFPASESVEGLPDVALAEAMAQELVDQVEEAAPEEVQELWSRVNAATKKSLYKTYETGILTRSVYENIRDMYDYYIPLRGFSETTADDVYEYLQFDRSSFSPPVLTARGRKSMADDPFATIGTMAESAIQQGNNNWMKQKFLNMALNHESNLISVREMWYENKGTEENPDWIQAMPDIEPGASAMEVNQAYETFEQRMADLVGIGMAKKSMKGLNIPYRTLGKQAQEHSVIVKSAGKEYVIFINGNPRAAQAINGLTNPDVSDTRKKIMRANRWLAANYTTRSPKFMLRNLSRDTIYSLFNIYVKEDKAYNRRFRANLARNYVSIWKLMRDYSQNKLDATNQEGMYMQEFLANGGETGYTVLKRVDEYKRIMSDLMLQAKGGKVITLKKALRYVFDQIGFANRCIEDICRFTAFTTSRQMGRSVEESIADAKNVSVNFNKKGSGQGYGASTLRTAYLFYNAGVQGLDNFVSLYKKNPKKFTIGTASVLSAGALIPFFNQLIAMAIGGDPDEYLDMPEWIRRNNLVIGGDGFYITIPLPIELRAIYGIGDIAYMASAGRMKNKNIAGEILGQLTDVMPVDPVGNNAGVANLVPDIVAPLFENLINEDFTGRPIFKSNSFNRYYPAFTKAYAGTNKALVRASELINRIGGGDDVTKGWVENNITIADVNNPAKWEHILEGYFGGALTTANEAAKTLSMIWDPDQRILRNVPLANVLLQHNDERTSNSFVNDMYYYYKEEYDKVKQSIVKYGQDPEKYSKQQRSLENKDRYKRYLVFEEHLDEIKNVEKELKEAPDDETKRDLNAYYNRLKGRLVDELVKRD